MIRVTENRDKFVPRLSFPLVLCMLSVAGMLLSRMPAVGEALLSCVVLCVLSGACMSAVGVLPSRMSAAVEETLAP
jgi:hypothetical protein